MYGCFPEQFTILRLSARNQSCVSVVPAAVSP